jgi:hypothetical protein
VSARFEHWINRGAADPRDGQDVSTNALQDQFVEAERHWAFQAVRCPPLPDVAHANWAASPIDMFILARLEEAGLEPAREANRHTLIRRLYFDLVGLPPQYEEVRAFVGDKAPDAYERLVDRLLASPHFGERWGRHWLDVARYADTKDLVLLYGKDSIRPFAWTYRDYVIRAFNEDLPYDQFIHDQLAADRMRDQIEPWRLAAMGLLTLGRLFDNNPHDIYDDQIDTVTRGLLGLTVACARCHDHKYDAIATDDYYGLYGVFANSMRPIEPPRIDQPRTAEEEAFEKQVAAKRAELKQFIDTQYDEILQTARTRIGDYLVHVAVREPDPVLENAVFFLSLSPGDLKPQFISAWRRYLARRAGADDPLFGPWFELMQLADDAFVVQSASIIARWLERPVGNGPGHLNALVREMLADASAASREDLAMAYGLLFQKAWRDRDRQDEWTVFREPLMDVLESDSGPFFLPRSHAYLYMSRVPRGEYHNKLLEIDKLAVHSDAAVPRARVLVDSEAIHEPRVLHRGNPTRPGRFATRRFLPVIAHAAERHRARSIDAAAPVNVQANSLGQPFTDGSGRLEMARAITHPDNPLTARVMVNRIWMHHFGQPLVATPSDFGSRGSPPTHPQLLDWLAYEFQASGWSMKHLHRLIVTSRVYRQSSDDRGECRAVDADNRLLWRYPRRRLDLEAMRDAILAVSGRLDRRIFGRPVDIAGDPENRRRTVYGLIDRQSLPGLYRAFDFASPDQSAAGRPQTTTPQQALFGINSPFMQLQAQAVAERTACAESDEQRINRIYALTLQRMPDPEELADSLRFTQDTDDSSTDPWSLLAHVLMLTNEFHFVD